MSRILMVFAATAAVSLTLAPVALSQGLPMSVVAPRPASTGNYGFGDRAPGAPAPAVACRLDRTGHVVLVNEGGAIEAGYKIIYRIGDGPAVKAPLRQTMGQHVVLNTGQTAAAPLKCRARVVF